MSVPPSVTKISKDGEVIFISSVDRVSYTMKELCRAALRDVGKFVVKEFRKKYYKFFDKRTGNGGRATYYKVYSSEKTIYPRVELGLPHSRRGKEVQGFYAYFQEFGTSRTPKYRFLSSSVEENIDKIILIQSQYLSALENEAAALSLISEEDYEGDGEE